MKKYIAIPLAAFCLAFIQPVQISHSTEVVERILAVVNDEIITDQDLNLVMAPVVAQYRTMMTDSQLEESLREMRQDFLNKLIDEKLVLSQARRKEVIVKDIEVDEMMSEVRNKFPSRDLFLKALEDQGMSEKKLWNRFRDQLMAQKYVSFEVRSKISVSPGEINDYYKANEAEFKQGERVRLRQILIREASRSEEEAAALVEKVLVEIKAGKPFEEIARAYSEGAEAKDGGDMGWIERGRLLGEIDDKVFALEKEGVTDPIKSALGYHLFKLLEREGSALRPIGEVRDQIQDKIFREKLKKRLDAWMLSLKKNAYISIR